MFKQLNCAIFVCLISHVSFIFAVPTAHFSPPSSFSIGKEFTAGCTVNGLDASATYLYLVNFYINSSSWFNVNKDALVVGFWTGTPACSTCSPIFGAPDNLSKIGLKSAAGQKGTYPQFEIKITPLDSKAYGTYFCSVKIEKTKDDPNPLEYKSNEWQVNSQFALMPSIFTFILTTFVLISL